VPCNLVIIVLSIITPKFESGAKAINDHSVKIKELSIPRVINSWGLILKCQFPSLGIIPSIDYCYVQWYECFLALSTQYLHKQQSKFANANKKLILSKS
jgi:hypothetical protein